MFGRCYIMNSGNKLYQRAKQIIPGAVQLLSKRAELLCPGQWPAYFSKAKGIDVWDLDNQRFKDMLFIVGTNVLGYCDRDVNRAVIDAIRKGNMTSLNSPEEVELAEKLLSLHPWAGGVRFAKGGNEAMQIAVRIARAYTGRDAIAVGGYFGHGDFYLAVNLLDSTGLDEHLLPGLLPAGVPQGLRGTAIPFRYNDIESLEKIAKIHKFGAILIEPIRHHNPNPGFLKRVQEIAKETGAVLIVDEITTGFRKTIGGVHTSLGLQPDVVCYSKAISNGYPLSVVIGRQEIMDVCQDKTFLSSTSWSDRLGFVAGLATIDKLQRKNVPAHLCKIGKKVAKGWKKCAEKHNLAVNVHADFEPIPCFEFGGEQNLALNTLFVQEMLARGYLSAPKGCYVSYAHKSKDVDDYLVAVDEVFGIISEAIREGTVMKKLKGPVAHDGFRRLTT